MTREIRCAPARLQVREPADKHFGRMEAKGYRREGPGAKPAWFEVYRTDQIRTSSTLFAGGDWHWRLCDSTGEVLVDAGGYPNEETCRTAVSILQKSASLATLGPIVRDHA